MEHPGLIAIGIISLIILIWCYVSSSKLTPEEKEKLRQKREELRLGIPPHDENGNIVCPRCGSTQIELSKRRWSPVTGFYTNKSERICMNCMKKF